jgi:hypothetical protein
VKHQAKRTWSTFPVLIPTSAAPARNPPASPPPSIPPTITWWVERGIPYQALRSTTRPEKRRTRERGRGCS